METRASYFLVGLFVLVLVVSLFGFVVWLARFELQEDRTFYYVYIRGSVTGLSVGSPVRYRGVPVGTVTDIAIDTENVELIQVTLSIKAGTPIKADTVASLQLQGITGLNFVQLSGGTQDAPPLEPRPGKRRAVIAWTPSPIERVFESAPELVTQIASVAVRANDLLSPENQKQITILLENSATISAALARSSGGVEGVLADAATTLAEFRATAASINELVADLRHLSTEVGTSATQVAGGADKVMAEIRQTAARFERVARQLELIVGDSRGPIKDFANSGLYDLSQFVIEARALVASLSRLAFQLERDPARFLFGDQQKGFQAR